jgi:predicted ribosome quality control (RQC) complex YloA/Tae2 family protein
LAGFVAELSGLEFLALAKEIESSLRGTYVKNVYSLDDSQLLCFGRTEGDDVWVVASPRLGVWISQKVAKRTETTEFTTRLRREVLRARFVSSTQVDLDRIVDIALGEGDGLRHLVVEMMPPGNIVVTNAEMKVLLLLNEVWSRSRRLVRGRKYAPPPGGRRKSPMEALESDVATALQTEGDAGGLVGRNFSLPKKYVTEVLARLGVDERTPASTLGGREKQVVKTMRDLVSEADSSPQPSICETPDGDELFVIAPVRLSPKHRASSVSELCDLLFLNRLVEEVEVPDRASASKAKELEATIVKLKSTEQGLVSEAARVRALAEQARSAPSVSEALAAMKSAGVLARREPESREAAASGIYDRAKELERQAADAKKAAQDLSRRVPAGSVPRRGATTTLRRGRREWYEKFRWFFTSQGKLAVGGRDAQSNSILVKKRMERGDTVYHADLFGSPFFVLKGGREQTQQECSEVAQATVAFSSAWKTGLASADAYWISPDQVGTAAPSGEYLPRGSFTIRGRKNFVRRSLVEVAVGLDSSGRVLAGPEAALAKNANCYVVLRPQREKSSDTAKKTLRDLQSMSEGRSTYLKVDDVLRALPAGGGKVVRRVGTARTPEGEQQRHG